MPLSGAHRLPFTRSIRFLLSLGLLGGAIAAGTLAWPALEPELAAAAAAAGRADGRILALAGVLFAAAPASSGLWAAAIGRSGGRIRRLDACARFGIGSLVNSVAPAHLGGAVRTTLLLEPVATAGRRRVVECLGTVQLARLAALGGLLLTAAVPVLAPLALVAVAGTALLARRGGAARLALLAQLPILARLAAATTVLFALGLPSPLRFALAAVAALELAAAVFVLLRLRRTRVPRSPDAATRPRLGGFGGNGLRCLVARWRVQSPRKDAGSVRTVESERGCVRPRTPPRGEQRGRATQRLFRQNPP